jgi:acyl-CoA thioesterase-1
VRTLIPLLLLGLLSVAPLAAADEIRIVALGASQTNGKGVPRSDAYPAQLERILRAEGYSVSVMNEGVDGQTTRDILGRLSSAVPDGTRIVIVQPGTNDRHRSRRHPAISPAETRSNVEQILAGLKARNITAILLGYPEEGGREVAETYSAIWYGQPTKDLSSDMMQEDGQHLTREGYAALAKNISVLIKDTLDKLSK